MGKSICFQCNEEDIILEKESVCSHCDSLNRKNDYLSGEFEITKENINLYYEFMSDEDLKKYRIILGSLFNDRNWDIIKLIDDLSSNDKTDINFKLDWIEGTLLCTKNEVFGVKDSLAPIGKYISQIKESELYKKYISKRELKS